MSKYRFKTREEFIRDGLWDEKYNCPDMWALSGLMNKYLGKDVPDKFNAICDKNEEFKYDGWLFQNTDYTLKEQQEYFDDLSQHIGRYIKALVDNPHSGIFVKKGDVGKIINKDQVAFPNNKEYYCSTALNKNCLGIKYELLPEDYSPEQEPNIEFISGKWYNFTTKQGKYNMYVKVDFFTDKKLYFKDGRYICNKVYDYAESIDLKFIENPRLLEDLSEIQKYLPDGHLDKFINSKFEIGKWYKWYQKNHGNYHYGKVERIEIETDTVVMSPWIIQCNNYSYSGTFDLSKAEQIQEISVEDIQEFLPKDHSDKISKSCINEVENLEFKKGEYIVITDNYSGGFCTNYIYKQRKDYEYLEAELDNNGNTTNGFARYEKKNPYNWRYATQEEIDEYERRGNPYDVTELQKKELSMEEIQEECKKRFPIGCTLISVNGISKNIVLKQDHTTYTIVDNMIYAGNRQGCLYFDGKYATLVSLPKENITEIPEYVECVIYDSKSNGKIFNTNIDKSISEINSWKDILIKYGRLEDGSFKISNKEAYEKQKSQLKDSEELTTKIIMGNDPCKGTPSSIFTHDEVGQYLSTAFDYWKEIPKFTEQDFDIYGPTPDIE